ncbi:hypothetical protein WJX79_008922 [Trebouxia sp. C0005]
MDAPGHLHLTYIHIRCLMICVIGLETAPYNLRRFVFRASIGSVILGTVKRSIVSETVSKTEQLMPIFKTSVQTNSVFKTALRNKDGQKACAYF